MTGKIVGLLKVAEYPSKFIENRKSSLLVFLIFISLLVSCSPMVSQAQPNIEDTIPLTQGNSIGQTFVASDDGLMGFRVYLEPVEAVETEIILSIRSQPTSGALLGSSALDVDLISEPGFYEFSIEPIAPSRGEYHYAELMLNGPGSVEVGVSSIDAYINGALYINGQPQDMQMAFNLSNHPGWALYEGIKDIFSWAKPVLVGSMLFVIPGWGFLSMLWSAWENRSLGEKLILSSGLSTALYPVLLLWLDLIGLQPGALLAWLPAIAGILIIAWRNRYSNVKDKFASLFSIEIAQKLTVVVFGILVSLLIFTRFWSIGQLELPQWGDSYHHTMISQLIVDHKGLFDSWEPYAELNSFTYHFGFHVSAALFHWVTGDQMTHSVLWVGQLFNVLSVLVLFPLATKLAGNRWGGVVAVLFAGLMITLPMFYVNWGRYTQLAGQVILPVMMYITWDIFEQEGVKWRSLIIPAVLIAGLSLSHYRVLFFAIFFMLAAFIFSMKRSDFRSLVVKAIVIGVGAFILFLPWFLQVYGSTILQIFRDQISTAPAALSQSTIEYNTIGDLTVYLPLWAWLMMGAATLIGLIKRPKHTLLLVVWCLMLLIGTNPNWIGLPGTGVLSNFALFIAVYIPAGLLIGLAGGTLIGETLKRYSGFRAFITSGTTMLILILSYMGALNRLTDVNIDWYALATRPDVRAAAWIMENVPEDAIFLVNSFLAYDGTLAVGSDGGLWLPLLAERDTTLPPITYGFESGSGADNLENANNFLNVVYRLGPTHPDVIEMFQKERISHVYIGQRRGRVNYAGETLEPQELFADPHYQPIYNQDLVWIFRIIP